MIESPANIGLYTLNDRTALIDSGNDKDAGHLECCFEDARML